VPDYLAIPLLEAHHVELHASVEAWERDHWPQLRHSALTMLQGIYEGVLKR
jgi:hypothetical protein